MGSWFSNLSVRKNGVLTVDDIAQYIRQWMAGQQYLPAASEDEADISFALAAPDASEWISVYSDFFSFDGPKSFSTLATPMSTELHADVLGIACFDSDYLFLNLIDAAGQVDAYAGIGSAMGLGIRRRTNSSAWKQKVSDLARFKAILKQKYICAEEALGDLAPCLSFSQMQAMADFAFLEDFGLQEGAAFLHFKLPDELKPNEPPKFHFVSNSLVPFFVNESHIASALNIGGESKGLTIAFLGPYVEREEITFSDVCIEQKIKGKAVCTPIELKKVRLSDGQWAYIYSDPGFKIPPKVDDRLPPAKYDDMRYARQILVRFVPRGNPRKVLGITVAFAPHKNPAGTFMWNVMSSDGWSKEEYISRMRRVGWMLKEEDFD